ncbi:hypothetical protein SS50377_28231 [Spironucleus salmonicida]|uniref:Uncharacterized protein n=1 Tax=Spironucleus salmonicida TaxID=348837 RepID=V6LVY9_9EUKA|nr:hypothetical protein SS50377_28231 [Spironucleus salmonicida]|eukprot:EST48413.1 Hypothetical protein SS50377_11361 [Spironucleus salmonicida]
MNASTGTPRLSIPSRIPAFWSTEQLVELNGSLEAQNRLLEARLADLHAGQGPSAEKAQSDLKHISLLISKLLAENKDIQSSLQRSTTCNSSTETQYFDEIAQQVVDEKLEQLEAQNLMYYFQQQSDNRRVQKYVDQQKQCIQQLQQKLNI